MHHALGNRVASDAALKKLRKEDPVGIAYQFAEIHAYRGEIDLAFEWLERAEATNDSGLTDAITNPLMRSLHDDPRWAGARGAAQVGLTPGGGAVGSSRSPVVSKRTELKVGPLSLPVSE